MSNTLKDVSDLVRETTELNRLIQNQSGKWSKELKDTIIKINKELEKNKDSLPILKAGVYHAKDGKDAIRLIKKASNRTIIGGDYVVQLPAGVFKTDWCYDLFNSNGIVNRRVILRGAGIGKTVIQNVGDRYMFSLYNSYLKIENLTIDRMNHVSTDKVKIYEPIRAVSNSTIELRNVEIKNVNQNYAIRAYWDSTIVAPSLKLNNVTGGVHLYMSRAYISEAIMYAHTKSKTISFIDAHVNSFVDAYKAKCYGGETLEYGVLAYESSSINATYLKINGLSNHGIYLDNGRFNGSYVELDGNLNNHAVFSRRNSTALIYGIKADNFMRGIWAEHSKVEANKSRLTNIKEYSILMYNHAHIDVSDSYMELKSTGIRHFHLDKASAYTNRSEFHNGKEVARCHYLSSLQLYNSKMFNIRDSSNIVSYVYLYGESLVNDSGSVISCNVPNGRTVAMAGTRV